MTSYVGTALTPLVGRKRELRAVESKLVGGAAVPPAEFGGSGSPDVPELVV